MESIMVGSKASKTRACPKCNKPSYLNIKGDYYHEYYCRECKHLFYIKNKFERGRNGKTKS